MTRPDTSPPPDAQAFIDMQASPEFQELRRRLRSFVFPMTGFFLTWYVMYVLLSTYASDFMSIEVFGNINLGLLLGLGQFVALVGALGVDGPALPAERVARTVQRGAVARAARPPRVAAAHRRHSRAARLRARDAKLIRPDKIPSRHRRRRASRQQIRIQRPRAGHREAARSARPTAGG